MLLMGSALVELIGAEQTGKADPMGSLPEVRNHGVPNKFLTNVHFFLNKDSWTQGHKSKSSLYKAFGLL